MSSYVGVRSVAQKIDKLYWGDGAGTAQAVQKAYVGDPRGVAKLWYQRSVRCRGRGADPVDRSRTGLS